MLHTWSKWTANNIKFHLSSSAGTTLSLQSHKQQSTSKGHLIIDSRINVSVLGCTWAVVDTGQHCEMSGFANNLVKSDIPVCSSKTVVEVGTQKVLLGMHKAPYLRNNTHGLLSTGQAQEFGMLVDNTLCRYGGGQCVAGQDEHGYSYSFNLDVTDRLPTLQSCLLPCCPETGELSGQFVGIAVDRFVECELQEWQEVRCVPKAGFNRCLPSKGFHSSVVEKEDHIQ